MPLVEQLFCGQEFQAKKTPLGRRGVRVIVVVANLVSATAFWAVVDYCYSNYGSYYYC